MALRVLLADESVTIKKVFQLALQDFAVEVTPVTVGLDVLKVAEKVRPDIVFVDVLLQKKNGYDVCRELKSHPSFAHIPVVLIWSGFMEFDETRFKSVGADGRLEKPFDTQRLRQLVQQLVTKTQTQGLSQFLNFPKLPDFADTPAPAAPVAPPTPASPQALHLDDVEAETPYFPPPPSGVTPITPRNAGPVEIPAPAAPRPAPPPTISSNTGSWSMDAFESLEAPPVPHLQDEPADHAEDFVAVDLPAEPPKTIPIRKKPSVLDDGDDGAQWVQKTLSNYRLDPKKASPPPARAQYQVPEEKIDADSFVSNSWTRPAKDSPAPTRAPAPNKAAPPPLPTAAEDEVFELELGEEKKAAVDSAIPALTERQLEAIIRAQSKEIIEKVVWQVLPEIATRIIERELERLLNERKKT